MIVLGLGGSIHDFSACLVKNGEIRYAVEEERLTRRKHAFLDRSTFRCRAADYCMAAEGISAEQVDLIMGNDILEAHYSAKYQDRIRHINHHLAHAASAYYPSDFDEAAVIVVDGRGSYTDRLVGCRETSSIYYASKSSMMEIGKQVGFEMSNYDVMTDSVGAFYQKVTEEIGFSFMQDGKTMGLAPYGSDRLVSLFAEFYDFSPSDGRFRQTREQLQALGDAIRIRIADVSGADSASEQAFRLKADIAFALQFHTERVLVGMADYAYRQTRCPNLCLAGGVFLNSVANYQILKRTEFKRIFVQPAAGDAGTSIGSALYGYHAIGGHSRRPGRNRFFSPYLGRRYRPDDVEAALNHTFGNVIRTCPDDIYSETARMLAEGRIMGWFQGRSEIGPRALGNRSILADPRQPHMKDTLNRRIKHREPFRPFAPIVLEEHQSDYFELTAPSYHMLLVSPFRTEREAEVPSVVHCDGTGRIQTVSARSNPRLHALLQAFYRLTGVPVLLNTSFNDNGEPIVESPADAVRCFLQTDLDAVVIEDWMLCRKRVAAKGDES
jgi:carbamoyltransferase